MRDDKLKTWVDFLKFVVGTCVVGLITAMINSDIQSRQVEVEETKQLGAFLEQAIEENVATRRRFASYFATVTRSEVMRERWDEYKRLIEQEFEMIQAQAEEAAREAERAVLEIEQVEPNNAQQEEAAREKLVQARSKFQEAQNELKIRSQIATTSIKNGVCRLHHDTRIVEIVEEPTHCDVYYTKSGSRDRKYRYVYEREKCVSGADNIVNNLETSGFSCSADWRSPQTFSQIKDSVQTAGTP